MTTEAGGRRRSRTVIATTSLFGHPHVPILPGRGALCERFRHVADYREAGSFRGQRFVAVGVGNSAVQIATEGVLVTYTTLATRTPVRFVSRRPLDRDVNDWARLLEIERLPLGTWLSLREPNVMRDGGAYRRALVAGRPDRRPLSTGRTCAGVTWTDNHREAMDTVTLATGDRPSLAYLAGLGTLDAAGWPRQRGGG